MSPVPVGRDTVVSLRMQMYDTQGELLLAPAEPVVYLHGGYGAIFEVLESALEGKLAGEKLQLQVEPEDAFGEYDAELVLVEPVERYGEGVVPGMEVEERSRFYRITDVAAGKVVLDGNHPLAGIALRFSIEIIAVRRATAEEIARGVSSP